MTSIKTPNISIPLEDNAEKSTFFVSDSIKHLINEETFVASDKQNLKFATSDLILEVKSKTQSTIMTLRFTMQEK